MKTALQISQEINMYGCSEEDLIKAVEGTSLFPGSRVIWCAGCCSDAQELMNLARHEPDITKRHTYLETARQYLNRAKWGMKRYLNDGC